MRALIVDDESSSRNVLRYKLEKYCKQIAIVGEADCLENAAIIIDKRGPDLVFLDIQLYDSDGFELLKQYPNPTFNVIFITAFDDYAIKAFRYSALDYLLKPIDTEHLIEAVEKAVQTREIQAQRLKQLVTNENASVSEKRLVIPNKERDLFLDPNKLVFLEAEGSYCKLYLENSETLFTSKNLKHFEEALTDHPYYFRVHHSYLLNVRFVKELSKREKTIFLKTGQSIPIAKRRQKDFLFFLKKHTE